MLGKRKLALSIISLAAIGLIATTIVLSIQSRNSSETVLPTFTVTFDTKGGTEISPQEIKEGDKIPKPNDPIKKGFHLENWLKDETIWNFETNGVYRDMMLVASWDYDQYSIKYNFNGGTAVEEYRTSYNVDSDFELIEAIKDNVIFGGWFDENNHRIDKITEGMTGDLNLTARWLEKLIVTNLDETRGIVSVYGEDDGRVSVETTPIKNKYHLFNGWFDENNNLLSKEMKYCFSLNNQKTTYINAKYMTDEEEDEWNISHGVIPYLNEEANRITYGMYPQNNIDDEELINKLNELNETDFCKYYYFNHEYYLQKEAKLYTSEDGEYLNEHSFDNGTIIEEGTKYWFKVEPISWKILKTETSSYMMLADKLLDVVKYYKNAETRVFDGKTIYPNNYKYSDLREWLNGDFLTSAFYFNKDSLIKTEIKNDASTTISINNTFACENTFDYVFELSFQDYINENLGFSNNRYGTETRTFLTTDFSRSSKALYGTLEGNLYCGYKWTRSPFFDSSFNDDKGIQISRISRGGVINDCWCGANYSCAQPCINIYASVLNKRFQ